MDVALVDTHCHIHFPDYALDPDEVRQSAYDAGVTRLLCVGCTLLDSQAAVAYARLHRNVWATIGLHPHEASLYEDNHEALQKFHQLAGSPEVVAIGETGLDYYYNHSPKSSQQHLLRFQLDVAKEYDLPLVFHVREAFDDFWQVLDGYRNVRGVVHSFTAGPEELDRVLERGLSIGLNGILTFTKSREQLEAAKRAPLERILLETDAPFLTPAPLRGKVCEPKHVRLTAEFLAELRGEPLAHIATVTTRNAHKLFGMA